MIQADERRLVEHRQRLLGRAYQLFYDQPLHLVRGHEASGGGPR